MINDIDDNEKYDYILFDCPPTSNMIIQGVFLTCDYYFIPTIGDEISGDGVSDYISEIESTYLKFAYDNNIGSIILKKYFGNKPRLIGILNTIYKVRPNSKMNLGLLERLDKSIEKLNIKSVLSENLQYALDNTKNIFKEGIANLDNRSTPSQYGIPLTVGSGDIHESYNWISDVINKIV